MAPLRLSTLGVILQLLGQLLDFSGLFENSHRKNLGGVNRIHLSFEIVHFETEPVHRFAKLLFLCVELCALLHLVIIGRVVPF